MSELPSFKEGLIFDATKETSFKVMSQKPCLFKIASLNDYSKNYLYWYKEILLLTVINGEYVGEVKTDGDVRKKTKIYDNLSFIFDNSDIIIWKNSIYYYCSLDDLNNNSKYNVSLTRLDDNTQHTRLNTVNFSFECTFVNPITSYSNDNISFGNNGYEIILTNPVTTIDWNYNINGSTDELKYYELSLYNKFNQCIINTGKVYTNTSNGNGFVCNSLDDKSEYILVGYCVSQSGQRIDLPNLIIKTKYTTGKIYANLTIELDKHLAENNITAKVTNIIGEAKDENNIVFINSEKLDLKNNDNNVLFRYDLPTNNFLVRIWINGIKESNKKITILKLNNNDDYLEVYYDDGYFYATKHSCGLTSRYISNSISGATDGNIYLSILYCNGRIDIYASNY